MNAKLHFPVGIEIEAAEGDSPVSRRLMPHTFEQGTDGSARLPGRDGLEFRSTKIEDTDVLFNDTPRACRAIENAGCVIHNKCGVHVHVGFKQISDLSAKYRLFRFASCYERLLFAMLPPWLERATYCTKLSDAMWQSFQRGEGFNWWKDEKGSRYWWFNGASMFKHGTVEFRLLNGTLDSQEILGWVAVLECMFDAAVKQEVKLPWCAVAGRTPQTLLADLKVDSNPVFGNLAKQFILSHAN